jgi:glycosyltransferase involved in cell wall biosynthesis
VAPPGSFVPGAEVIETTSFDEALNKLFQIKADVVHDHSCWSLESPVRNPKFPLPFLSTTHVRDSIGWSRNVVYLSFAQREFHQKQLGRTIDGPIIRVPTDPNLKSSQNNKLGYLLFLGMVVPWKGAHRAAQLAQILDRELILAGPGAGEYVDQVKAMPNVTYVGEVDGEFRLTLLDQAYAMACLHGDENGWWEPGCGVVGEAGAFNLPVAAMPNGCLSEIVVTSENGWLGNDVEEVAELMFKQPYLPDPGKLAQVDWSAEEITRQYVMLYEAVANGFTWE